MMRTGITSTGLLANNDVGQHLQYLEGQTSSVQTFSREPSVAFGQPDGIEPASDSEGGLLGRHDGSRMLGIIHVIRHRRSCRQPDEH